jgi:hypothetical protein
MYFFAMVAVSGLLALREIRRGMARYTYKDQAKTHRVRPPVFVVDGVNINSVSFDD